MAVLSGYRCSCVGILSVGLNLMSCTFLIEKCLTCKLHVLSVCVRVTGRVDCVCALQTQDKVICVLQYMCTYVHVLCCVLFYRYLLCSRKANFCAIQRQ